MSGAMRSTFAALSVLAVGAVLAGGDATACIDYSEYVHWAGSALTSGTANGVVVDGDYAYVSDTMNGLKIFDITRPESPVLKCALSTPGHAWGLDIAGEHLYAAVYLFGLQIIDVADPCHPAVVGELGGLRNIEDVTVVGTRAYICDAGLYEGSFLHVVDVSVPTAPILLGSVAIPGFAVTAAVVGDLAYVAAFESGLQVVDVSEPASMAVIGAYDTPDRALDVRVSDDLAFVTDYETGLVILSVVDPASPRLVSATAMPDDAARLEIAGGLALVACYDGGLELVDVSRPAKPALVGNVGLYGSANCVEFVAGRAYVTCGASGLNVVELAGGAMPPEIAHVAVSGSGRSVAIGAGGEYAFAAWHGNGLRVFSLADPVDPRLVATLDTPGSCDQIALDRDVAVLADWTSGVQVVDVSRPEAPRLVATLSEVAPARAVAATPEPDDGLFLIATNPQPDSARLHVCNVSDPAAPAVVATLDLPCYAAVVAMSGTRAFVAGYSFDLTHGVVVVVDIAEPTAPSLVEQFTTPSDATAIMISGGLAYVGDKDAGLMIYDIDAASGCELVGRMSSPSAIRCLYLDGDFLYAAATGTVVYDVSDPAQPRVLGVMPGSAFGVAGRDAHVFAVGNSRFQVMPTQCRATTGAPGVVPLAAQTLRSAPNPFNPRTTLRFTLPDAGHAALAIYDARGQEVVQLVDEALTAGEHSVDWTGVDAGGRPLPSGTYFCRLETPSGVETRKLQLVR